MPCIEFVVANLKLSMDCSIQTWQFGLKIEGNASYWIFFTSWAKAFSKTNTCSINESKKGVYPFPSFITADVFPRKTFQNNHRNKYWDADYFLQLVFFFFYSCKMGLNC